MLTREHAARVEAAFPAVRARVRVVAQGVDVAGPRDAGVRDALGIDPFAPLVAHVSGIRAEKGFPGAWRLADGLRAAVPDVRYVHMGALIDATLAPAADVWFAARPWAIRLGAVPRARVLDVVAAATCTLHTSEVEGMSNALLESMALGVPPVARDIPASRAVISDGIDGLLYADDAAAASAVSRIATNGTLRRALGSAARRAVARFTTQAELAGYLRAYDDAQRAAAQVP